MTRRRSRRRTPTPSTLLGLGLLWLAGTIAVSGCAAPPQDDPSYLRIAITTSPRDLDPRIGADEASQRLHQIIFSPLLELDARLRVVPGLAERWEMPDPTTYIVHLRRGVRFHDGSLLTADDVVFTFGSFLKASFVSVRKGAYRPLAAVEAIDPHTVRFRLKEPFGSFPIQLVMGIVQRGAKNVSTQPVGTGPYRFVRAIADDRVVLRRFDDYYKGPAKNPGLVLKVIPDDTMRGLELRKGTIDVNVNDLSPDIIHELERLGEVRVTTSPGIDYAYVGLNLRDPLLSDVRVRQALAYAVDRRAIVEHLRRGLATPAIGLPSRRPGGERSRARPSCRSVARSLGRSRWSFAALLSRRCGARRRRCARRRCRSDRAVRRACRCAGSRAPRGGGPARRRPRPRGTPRRRCRLPGSDPRR